MSCPCRPPCSPDCRRPENEGPPAVSPARAERIRQQVRAGRCPFRAEECAWHDDCVKHWPASAEKRRAS